MGQLPKTSTLPWHRVLRASGQLAFPDTDPRFEHQRERLELEGLSTVAGRVPRAAFWRPELDSPA